MRDACRIDESPVKFHNIGSAHSIATELVTISRLHRSKTVLKRRIRIGARLSSRGCIRVGLSFSRSQSEFRPGS